MKIYESIIIVLLLVQIGLMSISLASMGNRQKMADLAYIQAKGMLQALEEFEKGCCNE